MNVSSPASAEMIQMRMLAADRDSAGVDRAVRKARRMEHRALRLAAAAKLRGKALTAKAVSDTERDAQMTGSIVGAVLGVVSIVLGVIFKQPKAVEKGFTMPETGRVVGKGAGALLTEADKVAMARADRDIAFAEADAEVMKGRSDDARRQVEERRDRRERLAQAVAEMLDQREALAVAGSGA